MKRKYIATILTYITLLTINIKSSSNIHEEKVQDTILYSEPYTTYSNGKIYVITTQELSNEYNINNKTDLSRFIIDDDSLIILDDRYSNNPNMYINASYNINDLNEIKEILNILIEYEKDNPSNWNRTYNSMLNEWVIHNLLCEFNINRDRTYSVDLDNNDEETFSLKLK